MIFGMPKRLIFGYLAIGVFMTGDGFDLTFLARYLAEDQGFGVGTAGLAFTVYGLLGAVAAWTTGVLADVIGAKRLMMIGGVLWLLLHLLFITVGITNPTLAVLTYGLRGIAYPLFMYGFVVLIMETVEPGGRASAMGWFWTCFSLGLGVLGAFIPSLTIPVIGALGTLWLALAFTGAGTLICMFLVPNPPPAAAHGHKLTPAERKRELLRGVTIMVEKPQISLAVYLRVLCNLSLYAFPVFMPLYLTGSSEIAGSEPWFTETEWIQIWTVQATTCLVMNVVWGRIGDRFGWLRQMRWFGFVGMAVTVLAFFYFPHIFQGNFAMMCVAAVMFGSTVTAFVPMAAIFPALAPEHPGAAISAHNLGGGLTTFAGPAIFTLLYPLMGLQGVIWVYVALLLSGTVCSFFIHPPQPGITDENGRLLPRAERARLRKHPTTMADTKTVPLH